MDLDWSSIRVFARIGHQEHVDDASVPLLHSSFIPLDSVKSEFTVSGEEFVF